MNQLKNKHLKSQSGGVRNNNILIPNNNLKAFTLVELIVVVTILAILATIGFVSYSGYLAGTRDTNRIAQLKSISDGLEMYRTKHSLPLPEDYVEVQASGTTIAYQGYVGKNILETIEYTSEGKDPKDGTYFSYYLTKDKKYYQLMAFLEEEENLQASNISPFLKENKLKGIINKTNATDYSTRYPTVYGKKLGILTDTDNIPIQEIPEITSSGYLDVVKTTKTYIARFKDDEKIEGTGAVLAQIIPNASCKRIKELKGGSQDGVYTINPTGDNPFKVYCDMTTDGGGWTYATMLADTTTKNLFKTANTEKITSLTKNISTKGQISDLWKDTKNKDIMLKCITEDINAYNFPFIIYDFEKKDIDNLLRLDKKNCDDDSDPNCWNFSSENLKAKWKNYNYVLNKKYFGSRYKESFQLALNNPNQVVWASIIGMYFGCRNKSVDTVYDNSPATIHFEGGYSGGYNEKNYCMTAIR